MNAKLIIVEGLPGFGKSTTAKLINEILSQNKIEVELFLEGNLNHPPTMMVYLVLINLNSID